MVMKSVKVLAHKAVHPDTPANKVLKGSVCTQCADKAVYRENTLTDVYLCGCC